MFASTRPLGGGFPLLEVPLLGEMQTGEKGKDSELGGCPSRAKRPPPLPIPASSSLWDVVAYDVCELQVHSVMTGWLSAL